MSELELLQTCAALKDLLVTIPIEYRWELARRVAAEYEEKIPDKEQRDKYIASLHEQLDALRR